MRPEKPWLVSSTGHTSPLRTIRLDLDFNLFGRHGRHSGWNLVLRGGLHLSDTNCGEPFVPKDKQIAAEVDRRRKAGEGFDRLAREMNVSRPTVVRAYDFANRDEAAAAAREGRTPTRPPYKWSEESRVRRRKPRT